ncbi:MAG: DUF5695 domain-containing protein [Candidatus Aminicenantales bacterium]
MKRSDCLKTLFFLIALVLPAVLLLAASPIMGTIPSPDSGPAAEATGPYFGQKLPGRTPAVFAPGIVSLPGVLEMRVVFSPQGDECFFVRSSANGDYPWKLYYAKCVNDIWTTPALAPFHPEKCDFTGQPFFSADGNKLYFTSTANGKTDIWVAGRTPQGWGTPQILPAPVNSPASDVYYSQTLDGTAYFASDREGTKGKLDLWCVRPVSGRLPQAENLGDTLNASRYDFDPCIDPQGRYIIFVAGNGMCLSYSDGQGGWKAPVNMNTFVPGINDGMVDSPSFSPDGKYFFWRFRNGMDGDLYWIENPIPAIDPSVPAAPHAEIPIFQTPAFSLGLAPESQTAAFLRPAGESDFDFTPGDRLAQRKGDGFVQLGDLSLRLRVAGQGDWRNLCTWSARKPVQALPAAGDLLASADLGPTLGNSPIRVVRSWVKADGRLALRFELKNEGPVPVEIGALGIPMVFDSIIAGRDLEQAHAKCSLSDPSIARDAGYVQVTRFTGRGSALLVIPEGKTPLEAWNPLMNPARTGMSVGMGTATGSPGLNPVAVFTDRTPRGTGFEGFHEWMVHTKAYAENEWKAAQGWNPPTSVTLAPGESRTYGLQFALAPEVRAVERTLSELKRPVAVGLPGYVLPQDQEGRLFLSYASDVKRLEVEPAGALEVKPETPTANGWKAYGLRGRTWGRSRVTVTYADGTVQTVHYYVIKPAARVLADMGSFLTTKAWFSDAKDPFGRAPSVMTYDREIDEIVTQCQHTWVCGLGDEGGATWLAAGTKLLGLPDADEVAKCEDFVDKVLWGNLQYKEGPLKYGVKRTLFYYEPTRFPEGFYSKDVNWTTWMAWSLKHTLEVPRTYNYPHVTGLYWTLYRLARNTTGLLTRHPWQWYLEQAARTAEAMSTIGTDYINVGLMEGTIFVELLKDLQREGLTREAAALEARMKTRADLWRSQKYPFGSEMAWDSTGQEEVYAWTRYFGDREKAKVCVDAILGYMPALPSWGYNGNARRFWDFVYGGAKLGRIERMIHHYGSSLNAIPVLTEYRDHPEDIHLLRIGHAGALGPLANIDREGFPSMAFHSFPDTMKCDPISGDVGPAVFGHVLAAGAYLAKLPEFGWQGFGGNVTVNGSKVRMTPVDSFRKRVYLASVGLWLVLDGGQFEAVELDTATGAVRVALAPADAHTATAFLRIEQPAALPGVGADAPLKTFPREREAVVVKLGVQTTWIELGAKSPKGNP